MNQEEMDRILNRATHGYSGPRAAPITKSKPEPKTQANSGGLPRPTTQRTPVQRSMLVDVEKLADALAAALERVLTAKDAAAPQKLVVQFPDTIRTVPAATENVVVERDEDGFVRRTRTEVVGN